MLFEVERDLRVGDLPAQRHERVGDERARTTASASRRNPMIAGTLNLSVSQAGADSSSASDRADEDDDRASGRQAQAPAVSDASDDVDELCTMVHVGPLHPAKPASHIRRLHVR